MWDTIYPYAAAILPTIIATIFFYYLIKAILESDRRERAAQRKWDVEHGHAPATGKGLRTSGPGVVRPRRQVEDEPGDGMPEEN